MTSLFSILSSLVYVFTVLIAVVWESEKVIVDAANFHVADLDGSMEDAHLDAHTDRIAVFLVQQTACLLDARHPFLGFQRDVVALLGVLDAVGVVLWVKLKLRGILVALVRVGVVDNHTVLLALQAVVRHVVVPRYISFVNELALLSFRPNGTLRLVDANDVHLIV